MEKRTDRRADAARGRWIKLTALWSFISLSLCGFGGAAFMMGTRPPDPYAQCLQSPLHAVATSVVMVDATDVFTDNQRARVRITIETERDRLPQGGRLTILSVNPAAPWEPVELASVCNPGTPAQSNPMFVTRSRVEAKWRAVYAEPIEKAIARAVEGPASPHSPIIVTIAAILARPDFDGRVRERSLTIISDLLEHGQGYSQLKGGDFWGLYRASALPQTARLDLRGVRVVVDYLLRGQYALIQGPKHREFWQRLFAEAGVAEVSFIGLQAPLRSSETNSAEHGVQQAVRKNK